MKFSLFSLAVVTNGFAPGHAMMQTGEAMEPYVESGVNYMCNARNGFAAEMVNRACFCGYLEDRREVESQLEDITGQEVACVDGFANDYPCNDVSLLSFLPLSTLNSVTGSRTDEANDIWGWVDPRDQREYAIIGLYTGTAYVDITDPVNPKYLGKLPLKRNGRSIWADIKVFGNYAFIVSESASQGMQILDLSQLRDITEPKVLTETAHYDKITSSHNIFINEDTGFAYLVGTRTCSGGLHMVDINDPLNPVFVGCYSDDGYTHDVQCVVYDGPDTEHVGKEICFASNEDTVTIVDVSTKSNPILISRTGYQTSEYTHQGWLTEDQKYFIFNDELDERGRRIPTTTYVVDVSDLDNLGTVNKYEAVTRAIDHNLYVRGEYVFEANYRAGLRILKINDMATANFTEVGVFDIYPESDSNEFNGAWSNFPFFPSGNVIISGIEQGLYVVKPNLNLSSPPRPSMPEDDVNQENEETI